jgi:5-methylcytosine-specific restriction endonuclease McrA
MPIIRGGSNDRGNIELLCPKCNQAKAAKLPHEFAQENGRLI